MKRRTFLAGSAAGVTLIAAGAHRAAGRTASPILHRSIPSSGEKIPALGLGTWQTFDVSGDEIARVKPVLDRFLALGGRVVDSSPMYGDAEAAVGAILKARGGKAIRPFLATKVWTTGAKQGASEMRRSATRFGVKTIDLMQVHNLMDWKVHLPRMREWKQAGTFRYIGVTHYQHGAFDEIESIMKTEKIDSIQIPYSVVDRAAEKRLLPAARDNGVAVLVLSPFESGALFRTVK
jgi:diketogulonate reductase-like aldo/keto reductase